MTQKERFLEIIISTFRVGEVFNLKDMGAAISIVGKGKEGVPASNKISATLTHLKNDGFLQKEPGGYSYTGKTSKDDSKPLEVSALDIGSSIIDLINRLREENATLKDYKEDCEGLMNHNRELKERVAELTEQLNLAYKKVTL